MAKTQNYNGRYCESEFEYAFLSFLEDEGWHYLHGNIIPRDSKTEVLYADDMVNFLSNLLSVIENGLVRSFRFCVFNFRSILIRLKYILRTAGRG